MIDPSIKPYLGSIAIALTFIGFVPYITGIVRGKTKPHVFTWVVWSIATLTVYIAQALSGGGAGSWSIGISGLIAVGIAILAHIKKADDSITRADWIFLCAALSAIPIWVVTSNPLYAVIILTVIDLLGYGPTIRKAYHKPHEEHVGLFLIMLLRNVFSLAALDVYSLTNMFFQVATTLANLVVVGLVWVRMTRLGSYKISR